MENNYEVISTSIDNTEEEFYKYLLGETLQEAEQVYNEFKPYITKMAKIYAKYSNIDQYDLFGEAILSLGRAKKKYNAKLGHFTPYAKFYIIDGMNECIRKYNHVVTIPSYIYKTNLILTKLKNILNNYNNINNEEILYTDDYSKLNVSLNDKKLIKYYKYLLNKKAINLKLTYEELLEELNYLPNISLYDENQQTINNYNNIIYKIIIDELKNTFTTTELQVANLLMEGMKKYEIMKELNKSDSWVENRMLSIKHKLIKGLT